MFENLNLFTAIVLYLLIWWVIIFCVLPLKIKPIGNAKQTGNMPGAPEKPASEIQIYPDDDHHNHRVGHRRADYPLRRHIFQRYG